MQHHAGNTALVTGFAENMIAARVVERLAGQDAINRIYCTVAPEQQDSARQLLLTCPGSEKVVLVEGRTTSMDLGFSGEEFRRLTAEVELIHHCASITHLGVPRGRAEQINLQGAREVLEFAENAPKLKHLVHWSTASVSGCQTGKIYEDELVRPARFRNVVEETRFRAEKIVRDASTHLPVTILRPSLVVGDSHSGKIDRFEGPYLLMLVMLNAPPDLPMPVPGRGDIPLNMVPIDYVAKAACAISSHPASVGRTFHIVDPRPLSTRHVFELIAQATGRPVPRGFLPTQLATTLLKTPGLERLAQVPRTFLEQLSTEVSYDDSNARELLKGSDIHCPSFDAYVNVLVDYVRHHQAELEAQRAMHVEDDDPLL